MFTRFHHVAIVVRDMETALRVYRDVLGLPVGKQASIADQGVHAALLPMEDGEIELLEPADPAGGVGRFLERRGEGFHHLCFETPDISGALAQAKAAGLPLIDQAPRPGLAGMIAFLHPRANHGVLVELAQPLAETAHSASPSTGVRATGLGVVYLAVRELEPAAATYARNFRGSLGSVQDEPRFASKKMVVSVGNSRLTLLSPSDPASPVERFLADRGEGLFGVCLGVRDFGGALRHLEEAGIPVEIRGTNTPEPLACLESNRVHGAHLCLCPSASGTPRHMPAG